MDHIMANINTLYLANQLSAIPVYLLTSSSLSCLLPPGKHLIDVDSTVRGSWCSLVPVGCPCRHVTTSGMVYNLSRLFGSSFKCSNETVLKFCMITVNYALLSIVSILHSTKCWVILSVFIVLSCYIYEQMLITVLWTCFLTVGGSMLMQLFKYLKFGQILAFTYSIN